jgi:beta-lactamase class A
MKQYLQNIILALLFVMPLACTTSQPNEYDIPGLTSKLQALADSLDGDVGIYVRHLRTGQEVSINGDSLFPSASIVKVPILVGVFDMIQKGEIETSTPMVFDSTAARYTNDDGLIYNLKEGTSVTLDKLTMLMIATSDNTASVWLQKVATSERINRIMDDMGYSSLKVNSRTPGREEAYEKYGWGQMTPREIADLMVDIRVERVLSAELSQEMYRILSRIYYDGEALAFIPPWVQTISKQGAVSHSRSEVVLVNAPSGDYVFTVVTKNQTDQSWDYHNPGFQLIRDVSRLLWQTFEPDSDWQEPEYDDSKYW